VDLLAEVFPVLVALYLVDSALVVRRGQVLLLSGWHGRFGLRGAGLRWPGLLPTAEAYLAAGLPLRATPDGLLLPAPRGGERLVRFEDMTPVSAVDGAVQLGPRLELAVPSRSVGPEVARVVERLRRTPRRRRLAELRRQLRRRCDLRALTFRRECQLRRLPLLKLLSAASFVSLLVVVPASLVAELRLRPSLPAAVTVALLLCLATLATAVCMLRQCGLPPRAVLSAVLPMLLFPPAAAHAASIVGRELFLGFEPLLVAKLLLPAAAFERLARDRKKRGPDPAGASPAGEPWDVDALVRELVLRTTRGSAVGRSGSSVPADITAAAFCPSCLAEYRAGFARCSDCDEALVPYGR